MLLNLNLIELSNLADNFESSEDLFSMTYAVEYMKGKNERADCRLW